MFRTLAPLVLCSLLGGCTSWVGHSDRFAYVVPLYKVEIVQGNVVTKEMTERVKPGMSRDQVRDLLGSPMLADPFHADRWDYVFTIRRQGTEPQARQVVARFEGERLKSLDVPASLPTEEEFVASINTFKPTRAAPKMSLTEAERAALPRPVRTASADTDTPAALPRSFPPLEK